MATEFRVTDVLHKNLLLLRFVGLWPDGRKYFTKSYYTVYSIWMLLFFLVLDYMAVSSTMFFYNGDFSKLSNAVSYFAQRSITVVQYLFFVQKLHVTKTIMDQLETETFQPKTDEERKVVEKSLNSYKYFTFSYFTFCSVLCIIYFLLPVLMGERRYPFEVWSPLLYIPSPWFEIVYIHQCTASWLNHLSHTGIDMLCAGLMAVIGSQCDLLGSKLINFRPPQQKSNENMPIEDYCSYFRGVINHHREILLLSKRVNSLFSQLVFGEFSLVIILLCTGLFRLSVVVKSAQSEFLILLAFCFAMSTQLFLYCWFGAEVYFKSEKLHSSSFHCDWIGSPIPFQKNLLLFMLKTAEPIKIYALHFFELSTVTFTSIMRSSWSFYVLLQQMNSNEE